MSDRIVVGGGPVARALLDSLAAGGVDALTATEQRAKALRDRGIAADAADLTDPAVLTQYGSPEVVVVTTADHAVARAARHAFPEAHLIACGSSDALAEVADRRVDPTAAVAGAVIEQTTPGSRRAGQLRAALGAHESLAVVTHDNPDPDAIASGIALAAIADSVGCAASVLYAGRIAHHENRALVNLLDLDLRVIDGHEPVTTHDGLALVDHSRPGVNNQLDSSMTPDIVIDHHTASSAVEGGFVDLRSGVGATSTLLVEYLDEVGLSVAEPTATALLFGILSDTNDFTRGVSRPDFEAAAWLVPRADLARVERIESPSITASTLETVATAIQSRTVEDGLVLAWAGDVSRRTAIAQAADRLLGLETATTVVVVGVCEAVVHASARARGGFDVSQLLRTAFDPVGSAGGHTDMAGAQVGLDALVDTRDLPAARERAMGLLRGALEADHAAADS